MCVCDIPRSETYPVIDELVGMAQMTAAMMESEDQITEYTTRPKGPTL